MGVDPATGEARNDAEFDNFALDYDAQLDQGLSLTGESKHYFAEGRMHWLARRLRALEEAPKRAMDFGCGTGGSVRWLFGVLDLREVIGIDPSEESLQVARGDHADLPVSFSTAADFSGAWEIDLAFCNGVFHHIPVAERAEAVRFVFYSLRPGGLFAVWENNAWNPATRYVMSRVPFDKDAILLFPHGARRLLRDGGFEVLRTDYLFVFPAALSFLRPLERWMCRLPTGGGQYLVLARRPG
jgi:SAM-dependent methyltransferase